jgi:hypothetical protein
VIYRFRNKELKITPQKSGSVTYYLVADPERGKQHRLYEIEYEAAQLLDGRRTSDKIAKQLKKKFGFCAEAIDVESFIKQLIALGFVEEI